MQAEKNKKKERNKLYKFEIYWFCYILATNRKEDNSVRTFKAEKRIEKNSRLFFL